MALTHPTPRLARMEDAVIVPFLPVGLIDDAYRFINPRGPRYAALKRLFDSEVLTLALLQQLNFAAWRANAPSWETASG